MTDKDILISDLNDISEILNNNGYGGWCVAIRKAVELLKEHEAMMQCIKGKCRICPHCDNCDVDENGLLKEQEAVVRCKDCKYYDSFSESCRNGIDGIMTPNFYCGNAERKEESVKWE